MKIATLVGLGAVAIASAASVSPVTAADLYGTRGSIKDAPIVDMPARAAAGPCYFRADLGYSLGRDPSGTWPVSNITRDWAGTTTSYTDTTAYIGENITNLSMENSWFGGVGIGCGMGSRGLRGELMYNVHGQRKLDGMPNNFTVTNINYGAPTTPTTATDDPIHSSLKSHTLMLNAYYDLGNWRGVVPYVGAGVGLAYNQLSETYFTQNAFLTNRIEGDSKLSLAWSLMAGIGWQISDRAILDFGYRYMDFGKAQSGRMDSAGYLNPIVRYDDLSAHEFKVGLRYHFGASAGDCCAAVPMK
jgi:opacity protein-like surface antigen